MRLLLTVFVFLFTTSLSRAAVESIISSLSGDQNVPIVQNASLTTQDQWYPFAGLWNTLFRINAANARVVLRYDDNARTFTDNSWTLEVIYDITNYDSSFSSVTTTSESVKIGYDPLEGVHYTDRDMREYAGSHRARLTVKTIKYNEWTPAGGTHSVTDASSVPSWLDDIYLDLQIEVERFYNITSAPVPAISDSYNVITNELDVSWTYSQGSESYDLEWLFIDTGNDTYPYTGNYNFDWGNATRVNVPDQHYHITLAYPSGILLVRVRGVGVDRTNYVANGFITRWETDWSTPNTITSTSSYSDTRYNINAGLLPKMNWAYSAGFAEDGKRMEGVQFYDGLMRGRESVAALNSDNNVIIASGAYDYEGRPAVSYLPYSGQSAGITYYPANALNDVNTAEFGPINFDADIITGTSGIGTTSGVGNFYSSSNTTAGNEQVADAGGYPYSQVIFMDDGTNRPMASAAAGSDLKIGSGKETHYFYATPTQSQLDRLFGNEVGYASHYKKNFTIDPNGVTSVSYIDQHGRVIATALAGEAPDILVDIDNPNGNPNTSVVMTEDLLVHNQVNSARTGTESEFTLPVTETSDHEFEYSVGVVQYCGECYTTCEDCKYDLVLMLTNTTSGDSVDITTGPGEFAIRQSGISSGTYSFTVTLTPGTYRVRKQLTLNKANLDAVRQTYIDYQLANPSTSEDPSDCIPVVHNAALPCAGDCHESCVNHYFVNGVYVDDSGTPLEDQGSDPQDDGPMLIAHCRQLLCDQPAVPDPCTIKYDAMIDDMSPGGQYFDNLPSRFIFNTTTGLQTLNASYDIDGWIDIQPNAATILSDLSTYASYSFADWADVRAHWQNDYAGQIITLHPEYCAWNYHCGWSCEIHPLGTIDNEDSYEYEMTTMYNTDGNFSGSDGYFWNPLGFDVTTPSSTPNGPTNANNGYFPYGDNNTAHFDPRFGGECDFPVCDYPSRTAKNVLGDHLLNFYPAYNNSNVLIGYYSLWYVALDPDNIAGTSPAGLSTGTIDFFQHLHGDGGPIIGLIDPTPGEDQVTPYQFFRSVYFYYRALIIEQGFVGDANVATCRSAHLDGGVAVPAYDAQGYLEASTTNPTLTPEGFTILYMHNPVIDIYGDGCDDPDQEELAAILDDLVYYGSTNPDGINNVVPVEGGCSCQMLHDYTDARGIFVGTYGDINDFYNDVATSLNDEFGGTTYTNPIVLAWYTECETEDPTNEDLEDFPAELICSLDVGLENVEDAVQTNCENENNNLTAYQDSLAYMNLVNAAADAYMEAYISHCAGSAAEEFVVKYDLHEYYYTLYYYDQAGNLVKTVPPEGVNLITSTITLAAVKIYRDDLRDNDYETTSNGFFPAIHDMKSLYAYNSLQQPINAKQNEQGTAGSNVWESGETRFWYDYLGRLVVSQSSKQLAMSPDAYSYTLYDESGRIKEVGQLQTGTALTTDEAGSRSTGDYYFYDFDHTISPTTLEIWIAAAASSKREVTYTCYDETWPGINGGVTTLIGPAGQENLRNRVASVVYDDDPATATNLYTDATTVSTSGFMNAFHYSYDVHGNVKTVVQETPLLETHNQDLKKTTYEYDLISGNVNGVYFQQGERDEFDHRYEYDADNRLHASYSSRDGKTWEKESKQLYYSTGVMKRLEIGDKTVQGSDYVYTINGWLKGMNRNTFSDFGAYMDRDLGQDADITATNNNKNFGADAAGFTLDYFAGDYAAVNSSVAFEAIKTSTSYGNAILPQYNGNIAGMATGMLKNDQHAAEVQGRAFTYDQLYRIRQSLAFHMDGGAVTANEWQSGYTQDNRYKENFTYDWNGNIKTVKRYDGTASSAVLMDDLVYHYTNPLTGFADPNSNLLDYIEDVGASECTYGDDLDDQSGFVSAYANYTYDETGAMASDPSERITGIEWNPYGKMKAVRKDQANNTNTCPSPDIEYADADVEYLYTASQQRLCKIVKPHKAAGAGISDQDLWTYYWYAYDAGGQLMAVYKMTYEDLHSASTYKVHLDVQEHDVYGSGRLGIRKGDDEGKYYMSFTGTKTSGVFSALSYYDASAALSRDHFTREIGNKQYEITNHLGNVLVTVSDKRLGYMATPVAVGTVDWYTADVLSYSDYYVFGAAQPGRTGGDSYRYGFNGMESDDDVKGDGLDYTTEYRQYDPRVGRWFSPDPVVKHWESRYAAFHNNPIVFNDPSGLNPGDPPIKQQSSPSTGNEKAPNGQSGQVPAGTTIWTYTGSETTITNGTKTETYRVEQGSVAGYVGGDGATYAATYQNGGFIGYTISGPVPEKPGPSSADPAVVAVPTEGENGLFVIPPAEGSTVITSEGGGGHVPSQDELCGINYNTGVNGHEVALAAGAQYMEKGVLVVTGGAIVLGAMGGVALFTAPVWGTALATEATMISQYGATTLYSGVASVTAGTMGPRLISSSADLTNQLILNNGNFNQVNMTSVTSNFLMPGRPFLSAGSGSAFEYSVDKGFTNSVFGQKDVNTVLNQTLIEGTFNSLGNKWGGHFTGPGDQMPSFMIELGTNWMSSGVQSGVPQR